MPLGSYGVAKSGWRNDEGYFRWGVSLPFAGWASFVLEEERRSAGALTRFGGEMKLAEVVALRTGFTCSPFTVSIGLGMGIAATGFDLSLVQHEALGATPYATVSYRSAAAAGGGSERGRE
jgi:hypothetical protein